MQGVLIKMEPVSGYSGRLEIFTLDRKEALRTGLVEIKYPRQSQWTGTSEILSRFFHLVE